MLSNYNITDHTQHQNTGYRNQTNIKKTELFVPVIRKYYTAIRN